MWDASTFNFGHIVFFIQTSSLKGTSSQARTVGQSSAWQLPRFFVRVHKGNIPRCEPCLSACSCDHVHDVAWPFLMAIFFLYNERHIAICMPAHSITTYQRVSVEGTNLPTSTSQLPATHFYVAFACIHICKRAPVNGRASLTCGITWVVSHTAHSATHHCSLLHL